MPMTTLETSETVRENPDEFPYGPCECQGDGCPCSSKPGPAAFLAKRDGVPTRLCTHCDLSSDHEKELLVKATDSPFLFASYDPLGALCVALLLVNGVDGKADA